MDRKPFGCSREAINRQICLKFSTFKAWVNPWGCLFSFFGPRNQVLDPKWTENLQSTLGKAWMVKFSRAYLNSWVVCVISQKCFFLRGKFEHPGIFIKNHLWFVFKNFAFQCISLYWRQKPNFWYNGQQHAKG